MNLSELPYWTEADDAELDLLLDEVASALVTWNHSRDRCENCALALTGLCQLHHEVGEKLVAIVPGWKHKRILLSRAAYYRAREEVAA